MTFQEDLKKTLLEELDFIEDMEEDEENQKTIDKMRNWISNFEELN